MRSVTVGGCTPQSEQTKRRYLAELDVWEWLRLLHQPGLGLPLIPVDDQHRPISAQHKSNPVNAHHSTVGRSVRTHLDSGGYCSTIQATSKQ